MEFILFQKPCDLWNDDSWADGAVFPSTSCQQESVFSRWSPQASAVWCSGSQNGKFNQDAYILWKKQQNPSHTKKKNPTNLDTPGKLHEDLDNCFTNLYEILIKTLMLLPAL